MLEKLTNNIDVAIEYVKKFGELMYKYRYYVLIAIFILCVLFDISGSSIGMWKDIIASDVSDDGVIFGKSRAIRSDEWAVLTPMTFSQSFDGFKYFSDIIRADKTDVFMIYGLPTLNIMQIFRPFQLGFIFLGISKGLSFFWCGRLIALFIVTFEMCMILTKKNKLLSLIGAIMITLAPMVQWWFAVNGIAEIFIFGQLAIILLHKYINVNDLKKRCLYLLGMVLCAGGYVMVMYPAWQITMVYIFIALALWIIIDNRKNIKINYKDIISIIIAILIFSLCMVYILMQSMDTIKLVMGTVYPGSRCEVGGHGAEKYFNYLMNIFTPSKDVLLKSNTCELSTMFSLFPIGYILAIGVMIKERKKDLGLILLLIVDIFLSIWCVIGMPEILSKLTLMSNTTVTRVMLAIGYADILILLRSISLSKEPYTIKTSIIISVLLTIVMVIMCKIVHRQYITIKMAISMAIMTVYLFYFAMRYNGKYGKYLFTCGITFVMIMAGGTVNPIRRGTDVIYKSNIIKKVQEINNEETGIWIVEELGFPVANYILMAGVPVINSTNTYPNMERWKKLDLDGHYEDVYNRYAHIGMKLRKSNEEYEEKFELIQADAFNVYIEPQELKELNVKYIFTINELEKFDTEEIKFVKLYDYNNYKIYKIN